MAISKPRPTGATAASRHRVRATGLATNGAPAMPGSAALTPPATDSARPMSTTDPFTEKDAARPRSRRAAAASGHSSHGLARTVSHAPNTVAAARSRRDSTRLRPPTSTRATTAQATVTDAPRPMVPSLRAWSAATPTIDAEATAAQVACDHSWRLAKPAAALRPAPTHCHPNATSDLETAARHAPTPNRTLLCPIDSDSGIVTAGSLRKRSGLRCQCECGQARQRDDCQHRWGRADPESRDYRADPAGDDGTTHHRRRKQPRRRACISRPELRQPHDAGWKDGRDRKPGRDVGKRRRAWQERDEQDDRGDRKPVDHDRPFGYVSGYEGDQQPAQCERQPETGGERRRRQRLEADRLEMRGHPTADAGLDADIERESDHEYREEGKRFFGFRLRREGQASGKAGG